VLIGSTPRGGVGMATLTPEFLAALEKKRAVPDELLLDTLFTPSAASQAAGRLFLDRIRARKIDRDPEVNDKVAPAQTAAIAGWGAPEAVPYAYLAPITQPVLLVEGSKDLVFYTVNAFNLQQHLANAELTIYPDTGHGPQDQYPDRFVQDVTTFLDDPSR
jgi:pimeloyl-ACP methyl ester carboxylesterase